MISLDSITGSEISVINNPFNKESTGDVVIRYSSPIGICGGYWYAKVEFKNGHTSGEQRTPNCETFEEVIAQLKLILNSVNV